MRSAAASRRASACYSHCVECDTDIVVSWRSKPRGFVALMGLYESNHFRLQQLAGNLAELRGTVESQVAGDCRLSLSVLERAPYTSELRLTYLLPDRVPDLRLRVYHDADLVEALGPDKARERELGQRWLHNMMLNKWLEYCAERGHQFR